MQTQLCEFCLKSGMLCSKCQEKVSSGAVSQKYIDVAKKLVEHEDQYTFLQDVRLDNVFEVEGFLVLVVGKGDLRKFETDTNAQSGLEDILNKKVLVIESGVKDRVFLEDLFAGQHIVTINIIWLPDGSTETRVVLRGRGSRKMSEERIKALREIAKKVKEMDLRVEYTY